MMGRYSTFYDLIVKNKTIGTVSLILFCLVAGFFGNSILGLANKIIRLTTGLLALPIFFHLFATCSSDHFVNRGLAELGKYTLVIYILNYSLVKGIPVPQEMGVWSKLLVFTIIAVLYSFSFVFVAKIIEKSPFLTFCLLGRRTKIKAN